MDAPQKYIRTFGGDMETLKGGGTPELVPFKEKPQVEQPVAPLPVSVSTQSESPAQPPSPEVPSASAPVQAPMPERPSSDQSVGEEMIPPVTKDTLKTYSGDFSSRMRQVGASTATVLAAEQDAGQRTVQVEELPRSRASFVYGILGGIFFIAALGTGYFAYSHYTSLDLPVPIITGPVSPIVVEERADVKGSGKDMLQQIQQSMVSPLPVGSVRLLSAPSASSSVFSLLQLPAPSVVLRNIVADASIAGIIHTGGEQSPFFVLGVTSFGDTFAGMLQWETRMGNDLAPLFPPRSVAAVASSSPVATTTNTVSFTQSKGFVDKSISNHDVRVLLDSQNKEVMLYGYWNQHTLVIARDTAAFTELMRRLANSRVYR